MNAALDQINRIFS